MDERLRLATRRRLALPLFVALLVGARLIARATGFPDVAAVLALTLLLGLWACVCFVRSELRSERERRPPTAPGTGCA